MRRECGETWEEPVARRRGRPAHAIRVSGAAQGSRTGIGAGRIDIRFWGGSVKPRASSARGVGREAVLPYGERRTARRVARGVRRAAMESGARSARAPSACNGMREGAGVPGDGVSSREPTMSLAVGRSARDRRGRAKREQLSGHDLETAQSHRRFVSSITPTSLSHAASVKYSRLPRYTKSSR